MLIIERKDGQFVDITKDGEHIATIQVHLRCDGAAARLLFDAPPEVRIMRPEYQRKLEGQEREAHAGH